MDRKSNFSPFKKWLQVLDSREISGAPGEIRTPDPLLRRQMLYPPELRARGATIVSSCSYSNFLNCSNFNSRSIRSSWGFSRRNLKPQTDPGGPIMAKFDSLFQFGVNVPDLFVVMPHPKTFEVLWNPVLPEVREAKTPESMRSALRLLEDC